MPGYAVELNRVASLTLSVGAITADATTPRRGKLFRAWFGSEAPPTDAAFLWQIQRCTSAGTASGVTPKPLDPADPAAIDDAGENHTVDPTLTAGEIMLSAPGHQRATVPFFSSPGREIVFPGAANNGLAFRTPTANLVAVTITAHYEE